MSYYFIKIILVLREFFILRIWVGYYVKIFDSNFVIGKIEELSDYYIVVGFSGYGFMMVFVVVEMVVDLIMKGKIDLFVWWYDLYCFERGEFRGKVL